MSHVSTLRCTPLRSILRCRHQSVVRSTLNLSLPARTLSYSSSFSSKPASSKDQTTHSTRNSTIAAASFNAKLASDNKPDAKKQSTAEPKKSQNTVLMSDEELRQKLEEMSGEGGVAGLELEGGKPVAMKRGVRDNMFRVI